MQHARPPAYDVARPRWLRRIGWLLLIWLCGVAALGLVALLLRLLMGWAGLTR